MRFKNCDGHVAFSAVVKGDFVFVKTFFLRKKVREDKVGIDEYLKQDTEYARRMYLFEQNVNNVKTEWYEPMVDLNLDVIHKAVNHALREAGRYELCFADRISVQNFIYV